MLFIAGGRKNPWWATGLEVSDQSLNPLLQVEDDETKSLSSVLSLTRSASSAAVGLVVKNTASIGTARVQNPFGGEKELGVGKKPSRGSKKTQSESLLNRILKTQTVCEARCVKWTREGPARATHVRPAQPAWDLRGPRRTRVAPRLMMACGVDSTKNFPLNESLSLLLGRAWTRVDPRRTIGPHRFLMNAVWDPPSIT